MSTLYYESSFAHHGIKGQKWGVRRFQNPDGTLTKAGRKRLVKYQSKSDFNKDDAAETEKLAKGAFAENAGKYADEYKKISEAAAELEKLENPASEIRTNKELRYEKAKSLANDFYQEETGRPLHLESRSVQDREIKKYYDGPMSSYMEKLYANSVNEKNGIGLGMNSKFDDIDQARRYYTNQIIDSSRTIANDILSKYGGEHVYGPSGAFNFDNTYTSTIMNLVTEQTFSPGYLKKYKKRNRIGE